MILLQRLSVKLAYLLIKQFYLINSFGPSVWASAVQVVVTQYPDRTRHPHSGHWTAQLWLGQCCCQAWGGILIHGEQGLARSHIRVSHVEIVVSITSTMTGPQSSIKHMKYLVNFLKTVSWLSSSDLENIARWSMAVAGRDIKWSVTEAQSQIQSGISSMVRSQTRLYGH